MVENVSNRLKGQPRWRNFLVVVQHNEEQVMRFISSPREKVSNIQAIDDAVIATHRSLTERYREPDFTVFTVRAPYAALVEKSLPEYQGWETAQREQLTLK